MRARRLVTWFTVTAALAAGCSATPAADNAADRTFLSRMTPHHERAIAAARIGETQGSDPRVRVFAQRIVREQNPELSALHAAAHGHHVDTTSGSRQAVHRIDDAQLAALRTAHGRSFDRLFVSLNITSEQGAYVMARAELDHGSAAAPRRIARSIANSPSEIRELQALLRALPA